MRSLLGHKRWSLKAPAEPAEGRRTEASVLERLLALRANGGTSRLSEQISFYPPSELDHIDVAVARLVRALERQEAVFVHGDFDVDGITSTALFYLGLKALGLQRVKVEIEDRQRGHGLNEAIVRRLINEKFSLLVTTDCGISDVEAVGALDAAGVDTIVTDHHQPPDALPQALALVNPKLPGNRYPNKELAGVGVAFQLLRALYEALGRDPEEALRFLDLVTLGTVADLVPLVQGSEVENHKLVRAGLKQMASGQGNLGLRTLMQQLGLDLSKPSAGQLSFSVAPHLNAANRVGDPRVALLLLTTQNVGLAEYLSETLVAYNMDRKRSQSRLNAQVDGAIEAGQIDLGQERLVWLEGRAWNPGILGLVASYVVDHYGLPAVLISKEGALGRASARSVRGFNMMDCLKCCQDVFTRYGGHTMAAGFTIRTKDLDRARRAVLGYAKQHNGSKETSVRDIDTELHPEQITLELYRELQRMAPFGTGNPQPKFLLSRVQLKGLKTVGGGKHLKCFAEANGCTFETIGFSMGRYVEQLADRDEVSLVFKVERNEWMGRIKVQLELADVVEPETC